MICNDKEEVLGSLDKIYVLTSVIGYKARRLKYELEHSNMNYNAYGRNPRWYDNKSSEINELIESLNDISWGI